MAKYPNKLVKFNTFNIIELISNATDIDISPIRKIDISISTITDIEINHIKIRSEDLDDYRYEIVSNRRTIDVYKYCVINIDFNIDFNSIEEDINSNCEIINDEYRTYNCNRKASIISISMRKTSIANINLKYREDNSENNDENIYAYKSTYTSYGIYNYKRGATTIHPRHR